MKVHVALFVGLQIYVYRELVKTRGRADDLIAPGQQAVKLEFAFWVCFAYFQLGHRVEKSHARARHYAAFGIKYSSGDRCHLLIVWCGGTCHGRFGSMCRGSESKKHEQRS